MFTSKAGALASKWLSGSAASSATRRSTRSSGRTATASAPEQRANIRIQRMVISPHAPRRHNNKFRGRGRWDRRPPPRSVSLAALPLPGAPACTDPPSFEETTELGAQLLVVLMPVGRGGALGGGVHHLVFLANDHQRAIRVAGPAAAAMGHHPGRNRSPSGGPVADPPAPDDRRRAHRRHGDGRGVGWSAWAAPQRQMGAGAYARSPWVDYAWSGSARVDAVVTTLVLLQRPELQLAPDPRSNQAICMRRWR